MRSLAGLLLVLLVGSLAWVPLGTSQPQSPLVVQAKPPKVEVFGGFEGRIAPETGYAEARFDFEVHLPPFTACASAIRVDFEVVDLGPDVVVTLNPRSQTRTFGDVLPGQGIAVLGGTVQGFDTRATITVDRGALAFSTVEVVVQAVASVDSQTPACTFVASAPARSHATLIVDYLPHLEATLPEGWTDGVYPIQLRNFGNGPTRVLHRWGTGPDRQTAPEQRVTLESRSMGSRAEWEGELLLTCVDVPFNWDGHLGIEAHPVQPTESLVESLVFVLHVPVCELGEPSETTPIDEIPELPGLGWFGAMAALAWAARRRR